MKKSRNRIGTNNARTVKRSLSRFMSLLIMSLLGMLVFVGLASTAPDMISTLDRYLDRHSVYDIKLVSTLGFDDADVAAVAAVEGVSAAAGAKSADVIITWGNNEAVMSIAALPGEINKIDLLSGRLPEKTSEIIVEENFLRAEGFAIGDTFSVESDKILKKNLTIVGTADSALYYNNVKFDSNRGYTNVGSGKVNYYAYMIPESFDLSAYTAIYVRVDSAAELLTSGREYKAAVSAVMDRLEDIKGDMALARYSALLSEAETLLADTEAEAEEKLADGLRRLEEGKAAVEGAAALLEAARIELEETEAALSLVEQELESVRAGLESTRAYLDGRKTELTQQQDSPAYSAYLASEAAYDNAYAEYSEELAEYEQALSSFREAKAEYENEESRQLLREKLYASGQAEYEEGLLLAEERLTQAREAIDSLKPPSIYIYDRGEYSTYSDYIDDSNSIRNLATLFPAVFFAVAVLVSLISMNKMVEEDRLEIGTMKSLGFPTTAIMSKYLNFSLWATIAGSVLGAALGMIVIPALIIHIYSILFTVPGARYTFQPLYIILGFLITVICVCGSSVWTAYKSLRLKPAELMRPKAPASGHRVVLERIKPLWKRLNFSQKIMLRNLFLYKKRVIVTIGGIACCTALLLTGFGIKDSIVDLPSSQYYSVYQFDAISYVSSISLSKPSEGELTLSHFLENEEITYAAAAQRITADLAGNDGYMLIADPADMDHIAVFESADTGEPLRLEPGKVIIDEKLAYLEKLSAGDKLHILDVNNNSYDIEISGIAKNYFEHFAYMGIPTYESLGAEYAPNLVYFQTAELSAEDHERLSQALLASSNVLNIAYRDEMIEAVDKGLRSLDSVVLILLVLSAMLAFVVLYNLATINISERRREIATLKVLGFYDGEVDGYISKETIILSVIGILLGLVLGIFLCHAVVNTIEVDKARFMNSIKPMSFVYSACMSAVFSLAVTFITHFRLKKIDMIDSLKSVE